MKFKPSPNKIIIKIKGQFNNRDSNGLQIDTTWNPEHHIRIEGEVAAIPNRFTSDYIGHKYPGQPAYSSYLPNYNTTSIFFHTHRYYTAEDCNLDIEVGDKIYFHYTAIQFEDFERYSASILLTDDDGYEYHQINVDSLIAVLKDGEIKPLLSRVLVQPIENDNLNLYGLKLLKSNKYLEGKVKFIGEAIKGEEIDISVGDDVMYLKNKEFKNSVEGEEYYVMRHWNIVAKNINESYVPVGEYVKIELLPDDSLIKNTRSVPFNKNGKVLNVGERVDKSIVNEHVIFNNRSSYFVDIDENTIFVRYSDIYLIKNA